MFIIIKSCFQHGLIGLPLHVCFAEGLNPKDDNPIWPPSTGTARFSEPIIWLNFSSRQSNEVMPNKSQNNRYTGVNHYNIKIDRC